MCIFEVINKDASLVQTYEDKVLASLPWWWDKLKENGWDDLEEWNSSVLVPWEGMKMYKFCHSNKIDTWMARIYLRPTSLLFFSWSVIISLFFSSMLNIICLSNTLFFMTLCQSYV